MPQRGGRRLSVFALTCAVGLGTAATASANEVTLWTGGAHVVSGSAFNVRIPNGLELKSALISRSTTFPEGSSSRYAATLKWYAGPDSARVFHSQELDWATTNVNGDVTPDAPASAPISDAGIAFEVTGAGAAADVQRVGLTLDDPADPTAAVGGIGPSANVSADPKDPNYPYSTVAVWANDNGSGLWKTELYIDDQLAGSFEYVDSHGAGQACVDALRNGTPLPLENDCLHAYGEPRGIKFDSTKFADGKHKATVKLYDVSGRVAEPVKDASFEILNHPDPGNKTANLSIGSGSSAQQNGSNNGGSGGVAGKSATSCSSPRLSMELSQRPLRVSRGVPVLVSGKRYRFRGKLTCLVAGKRRSAPARTPIQLLNTIGKRTYRKGGATVRGKGAITIILAYRSSRTLVFRYTNPDGKRSQVKLKIKVVKKSR